MKMKYVNLIEIIHEAKRNLSNMYLVSGSDIVEIVPFMYEKSYESFDISQAIYLNDELIYKRDAKSIENHVFKQYTEGICKSNFEVQEYLSKFFGDRDVEVFNIKPQKVQNELLEEEEEIE